MQIIDVTVPIHPEMVIYPGDPGVRLERVRALEHGGNANLSLLELGVHSGTHVDAPVHFIDGAAATEALPLDVLIGPARIVDASAAHRLDAATVSGLDLGGSTRVLFKTRNSDHWERNEFVHDFVSLTEDGAHVLVEQGVRLVGIDYLSVGDERAHTVLLGAGVIAVEGLDLRDAPPGDYRLICAPLRLVGSDGAPARVLLLRE